ncbi:hypothetical protein Hanom_Chr06g00540411 [Helianthus anomalus]
MGMVMALNGYMLPPQTEIAPSRRFVGRQKLCLKEFHRSVLPQAHITRIPRVFINT